MTTANTVSIEKSNLTKQYTLTIFYYSSQYDLNNFGNFDTNGDDNLYILLIFINFKN